MDGNLITIVLGAFGALVAIFLKEIAQAAFKRQILIGQLNAYVSHAKAQVIRTSEGCSIYLSLEKRDKELYSAMSHSKQKGLDQIQKNIEKRDEIRAKIKEEFLKLTENSEIFRDLQAKSAILSLSVNGIQIFRQYLADGKSFLSDGDAAHLGPAIAACVVGYRASGIQLLVTLEGLIKILSPEDSVSCITSLRTASPTIVDSFILDGENYIVSLIRLEKNVELVRKLNFFQHSINILKGK